MTYNIGLKKWSFAALLVFVTWCGLIVISVIELESYSPSKQSSGNYLRQKYNTTIPSLNILFNDTHPAVVGVYSPANENLMWNDPVGVLSSRNLHSIFYGVVLKGRFRTPLVMIKLQLENELLNYLLDKEHMFSCNGDELDKIPDLDKRVKLPVYIYEGYFHSLPSDQHIYSKNPNPLIAVDFMKPAASEIVRAFYVAIRRVNKDIFLSLQNALFASAVQRNMNHPEKDVCHILASWIQQDKIFGDLSIQIHYGEGNEKNFPNAWHVDAENSLLHLAVTLRGSRVLHSRRCVADHGPAEEHLDLQKPGYAYLSSSALMLHAPKFSYASFNDRVIAIHSRILYTSAELNLFRKYRTEESWTSLTEILADHLGRADLKLPSLQQVESVVTLLH